MRALQINCKYLPKINDTEKEVKPNGNLFYKDPELSYTDFNIDEVKPHEVLIRVIRVGLCGSDYHCIETDPAGYIIFSGPAKFPQIIGHEFVGIIEELGSNVPFLKKGEYVACESVIWCGHCPNCRRGNFSECRHAELIGLTCDGALKEYIKVPHQQVWRIDQLKEKYDLETALDLGTLLEPIGCAYKGLFLCGNNSNYLGATAAVYGAGPIGLSAAWLLKNSGVKQLFLFDKNQNRLEIAKSMGFENCINVLDLCSISQFLNTETKDYGIDITVECTGAADILMNEIIKSTAARGVIIYLSRTWKDTYNIDFNSIVSKGITIIGSRGHAKTFPILMKILTDQQRNYIKKMITKRISFGNVKDFLENKKYMDHTKVIVEM